MCSNKYKQSRKTHIILFDWAILRAPSIDDDSQKNQIVLHCPSEFDQRYDIKDRDSFLSVLQLRFANMDRRHTFRIYEVNDNLKMYTTTLKDRKYGLIKLPPEKWRCPDKEIAGSDEYKEEDETYDSEEDNESKTNSESEPEVPDERRSKSIVGNIPTQNSRTSVNAIKQTLLDKEARFNPDDLVRRESLMIFQSAMQPEPLTLDDFEITDFLGQGTFGKVYLTQLKSTGEKYAIKWIDRDILIEYEQEENTKLEEQILLSWDHEFVLGMDFVFENEKTIYFVMPYVKGGELYSQLKAVKRFPEEVVKFYAIQLITGIGYLHENGIIHRDLKLENILIGEDGYLKIIDFGLAKILKNEEETMTFWGTPEYLSPEVIGNKGHHKAVDWWAVGVLIYEMLIGVTPFYNRNRNKMLVKIQFSKVVFPDKSKYKIDYSEEVQDFILRLLVKDKDKRLGTERDKEELFEHEWFKDVDIDGIINKTVEPPFIP